MGIYQKKMWRLWAKALGEKAHADNKQADKVAFIRTLIFLQVVVTNFFISINIILNWIVNG
jgi:hypothetical protein